MVVPVDSLQPANSETSFPDVNALSLPLPLHTAPRSVNPPRQLVPVVVAALIALLGLPASASAQGDAPPTYTDSQAVRGGQWFAARCQSCHPSRDMSSPDFKVRWGGLTALDLFSIISTTMPQNEPGTLSRRAYTDIVAYLMQLNGLRAGSTPLTADSTVLAAARLSFATTTSSTR